MSPADKLEDNKWVTIDKVVKTFLETLAEDLDTLLMAPSVEFFKLPT